MPNYEAEFHNNRVERQLRPIVIFRKLSFGNRTEAGAYRFAVMASVIETARLTIYLKITVALGLTSQEALRLGIAA